MGDTKENLQGAFAGESQANRRYIFFADKADKEEAARLLQELAQEEKGHLKVLGRLMDRKIVGEAAD